jgi:uncharacterized protein YjbJ (UPF0337 family)
MSGTGKIKNQAEKLRGKAEKAVGRATDDVERMDHGRRKQTKADLKTAARKLKDATKH